MIKQSHTKSRYIKSTEISCLTDCRPCRLLDPGK